MKRRRTLSFATCLFLALAVAPPAHGEERILSLGRAMRLARERSPQVKQAEARVASADATSAASIAGYLPSASAGVRATGVAVRGQTAVPTEGAIVSNTSDSLLSGIGDAFVSARWTLWDFGRTTHRVGAADAVHAATRADEAATRARVARDAANEYFTVVFSEELVVAAERTVANLERHLAVARGLVKSGLQPPVEEVRAESALESARRDSVALRGRVVASRARLATTLAIDAGDLGRVARPLDLRLDTSPEVAARRALAERPELRGAQAAVDARNEGVAAATSRYWPTLALHTDALARVTHRDAATVDSQIVVGGISLTIPLFDATIAPGVASARAELASANAYRQQIEIGLRNEAVEAAGLYESAALGALTAHKTAELASGVLTIIAARYASGVATPIELFDAEASDARARVDVLRAQLDLALASVALLAATGQLVRLEERT